MGTDMGNKSSTTSERIDTTNIESPEDCVIALYGNLALGKKHEEIRESIKKWGATFEEHESRVEKCTHLVTTERYLKKLVTPAKIKDAALKGCEIVTLPWLLLSLECGYPINTKDYKLTTKKIAKLGLNGDNKASPTSVADGPKPSLKEADKTKSKPKQADKPKPLKETDDPNPRLKGPEKAKANLKEVDEPKLDPKKIEKPRPKSKGSGEAKRALEDLEDGGDGIKKVAKISSNTDYLRDLQRTAGEFLPDPLKGYPVLVQGGDVWDAILIKPSTRKTEDKDCQFVICRIQLLHDLTTNRYHTFSHEKTGEVITKASRSPLGVLEEAKSVFQESFLNATGLRWKNRLQDPKKKKFIYVEHHLENEDGSPSALAIAKTLPPAVKAVLSVIIPDTDQAHLIKTFLEAKPAGSIRNDSRLMTVHRLNAGIALLKRVLGRPDLAAEIRSKDSPASIMLQCYHYLIGPGSSKAKPSLDWAQREQDHLSYLHILATASQPNRPPGRVEEQLSQHLPRVLGLTHMALVDTSTKEYRILANYFNFSDMDSAYGEGHHHYKSYKNKLKNIFRIERLGEADRFLKWTNGHKTKGRLLLWHGSDNTSFKGIFEKGLIGGLGQPKIYLSGLAGYSTAYCHRRTGLVCGTSLMLLCEVASLRFEESQMEGHRWSDAGCVHADLQGVKMLNVPPGIRYSKAEGWPIKNEYSFALSEQIRMRYLFEFDLSLDTPP